MTEQIQARIGKDFHKCMEDIKDARLKNGKSKERIPTCKITNMIIKHKGVQWKNIMHDIINASEEEINKYGD